jgi:hypothetical protein
MDNLPSEASPVEFAVEWAIHIFSGEIYLQRIVSGKNF